MRVTGKQVRLFWNFMSKKYDFKIVQKEDAEEMKIVGWALEQMGVQKQSVFLDSFTTTIVLGQWRCVYVSFDIGKGSNAHLLSQAETCVHECQHVVQADREPMQPMKYLASDANRAFYEADAYRASMEMYYFFTGRMYAPKRLANLLRNYSVGRADRRIAEKHLIVASKVVKRGGVITGTSKVAIRWWMKRLDASSTRHKKMTLIKV